MKNFTGWLMVAVLGLASLARADLAHRYVFSNSVNDVVGSVNGIATANGTYIEAPSYVTAAPAGSVGPGMALSVGTNVGTKKSAVSINSNQALGSTGTVSLWFKPDTSANTRYVLTAGINSGFIMVQNATTNSINVNAIKTDNTLSTTLAYTGAGTDWHFYSITWDKNAGTATIYVDDASVVQSFTPANWAPTAFILGTFNTGDTASSLANQFDGLIYDVQIYDTALSSTDIGMLQSNPGSVIPEPAALGLVATAFGVLAFVRRLMM